VGREILIDGGGDLSYDGELIGVFLMAVLNVILLVLFVIVAILLILLVLVQTEEGDSLGGVFAGGSSSVFGSRSGNVLTKASTVLGALFLVLSFSIALINRTPGDAGVKAEGLRIDTDQRADWWREDAGTENSAPALDSLPNTEAVD
jgi:preprotein translocase subunit SecG